MPSMRLRQASLPGSFVIPLCGAGVLAVKPPFHTCSNRVSVLHHPAKGLVLHLRMSDLFSLRISANQSTVCFAQARRNSQFLLASQRAACRHSREAIVAKQSSGTKSSYEQLEFHNRDCGGGLGCGVRRGRRRPRGFRWRDGYWRGWGSGCGRGSG